MPSIEEAIARFDALNGQDPKTVRDGEADRPRELVLAERLSVWVEKVVPEASDALRLAARCQHLKRFAFPRSEYPEGRVGYLKWRRDLKSFHAARAAEIMRDCGYDEAEIGRVANLVKKVNLKSDPDAQALEDVACLVFLETQYTAFSRKHEPEKIIAILQKTWRKMSPHGQAAALELKLAPESQRLIGEALKRAAC